jgi:hypothetical protein
MPILALNTALSGWRVTRSKRATTVFDRLILPLIKKGLTFFTSTDLVRADFSNNPTRLMSGRLPPKFVVIAGVQTRAGPPRQARMY